MNKSKAFPIIVMSKDEEEFLEKTIMSLIKTVSIEVEIYIVDNNSKSTKHLNILDRLSKLNNVNVIRNNNNYWVLGLNKTISKIKATTSSRYFFITDGDIDFSNCVVKENCWLTYLINKMDSNISIGKIGLSLCWNYIENENRLRGVLEQEKSLYNNKKKINEFFVSQVDTTASIFRWDWSIEGNSQFYPGHIRYLRPELYSCRTPRDIVVNHLGWYKYLDSKLTKEQVNDKVFCFTLVAGTVTTDILSQSSLRVKYFYKFLSRPIHKIWICRRYYFLLRYILLKGRRLFDGQESREL